MINYVILRRKYYKTKNFDNKISFISVRYGEEFKIFAVSWPSLPMFLDRVKFLRTKYSFYDLLHLTLGSLQDARVPFRETLVSHFSRQTRVRFSNLEINSYHAIYTCDRCRIANNNRVRVIWDAELQGITIASSVKRIDTVC